MINENLKKDLVLIGFPSHERCHTEEKFINGKEFLKLVT
jgi:hypothetical protein